MKQLEHQNAFFKTQNLELLHKNVKLQKMLETEKKEKEALEHKLETAKNLIKHLTKEADFATMLVTEQTNFANAISGLSEKEMEKKLEEHKQKILGLCPYPVNQIPE